MAITDKKVTTMRKAIPLLLALLMTVVASVPVAAAQDNGNGKAKSVAEDPEGDWGDNVDPSIGPLGDLLGQDLVEAQIGMADKDTLDFIIRVTSLPPNGGVPELTRYIWSLSRNGEYFELDGKWTNYSRGACDPTSGQCPPPRDPGMQPFLVRGNCTVTQNVTTCEELGAVQATFDPAEGTISIPVPLEMIGAKKGHKITAGSSDFTSTAGGPIIAIPTAFFSSTGFPLDAMQMIGKFRIP